MQALHYLKSGKLEWQETPSPRLSDQHGALVKPTAVAACDLDRSITSGASPFPGPFILGHEFCGTIEAVGSNVATLTPGTRVIASFQPSCGICMQCGLGHSSVCSAMPNTSMYGIGAAGGNWGGALSDAIYVPYADFNLLALPHEVSDTLLASGSDNLADGLRAVDGPLREYPGASVLIAGSGSIPLYAILCAIHLGASKVTFASKDMFALEVAGALGADCIEVSTWPRRLPTHDITFDCTGKKSGLACVLKSTRPYGTCTSASIYFSDETAIPLRDLYMKGITFSTGRVNSAANLKRIVDLVTEGLDPQKIQPAIVPFSSAIDALRETPYSQKLILQP